MATFSIRVWNVRWGIFVFTLLATTRPALSKPPSNKSPPAWFWGCWQVTKSIPTEGIFGVSFKKEKSIIGARLVFSPRYASCGRVVLRAPKYSVSLLSAREFFKLSTFPLNQIGVWKPYVVQIVVDIPNNLSDLDFYGTDIYLRKNDFVINVENESFLVKRTRRATRDIQRIVGARIDGKYGPETARKIREFQRMLIHRGYLHGTADGIWGPKTERAYDKLLAATQSRPITVRGGGRK